MAKPTKKPSVELTDEQAVELIAEGVLKNSAEVQSDLVDAFEVYAYHVQAKVFATPSLFKERCLKGYRNLIKENSEP